MLAITKASNFGLAAAKITVSVRKPNGVIIYRTQTRTWVMGDFFITPPQFVQGLDQQDKDRNYQDLMTRRQQAKASVCSYGDARNHEGTS